MPTDPTYGRSEAFSRSSEYQLGRERFIGRPVESFAPVSRWETPVEFLKTLDEKLGTDDSWGLPCLSLEDPLSPSPMEWTANYVGRFTKGQRLFVVKTL